MCLVPEVCELMGMNLTGALIVVPPVPTNWEVNIATPPSAFIHRAPVPHGFAVKFLSGYITFRSRFARSGYYHSYFISLRLFIYIFKCIY